jgi:hypothetical protein
MNEYFSLDFSQRIYKMVGMFRTCDFFCWFFRDTRACVLEQSLRKLGVEKLTKDDVQKMQWEVLEGKIGNWIHFMRIAVSRHFMSGYMQNVSFGWILLYGVAFR